MELEKYNEKTGEWEEITLDDKELKDKETMESSVNFTQWRENIMSNIYSLKKDTIIFTHFVVINAVIGEILKSDKIVNFQPSNCSITEISKKNDKLKIVKLGKSLESKVN